jgi:hypothetical protein
MYRAMIWKELRETGGILLLALVVFLAIATRQMGFVYLPWGRNGAMGVPFVDEDFITGFGWVAGFLAVALGLRQSFGESIYGTYPFLWHRPASRRWLLGMKLAIGASAYAICAAIPIVLYAIWASIPETHPSPFRWSMTATVWGMWFCMFLLYFAAFLSGFRPGRWYGTRFVPLVAALFIVFFLFVCGDFDYLGLWSVLITIFADLAALASIFWVARERDF